MFNNFVFPTQLFIIQNTITVPYLPMNYTDIKIVFNCIFADNTIFNTETTSLHKKKNNYVMLIMHDKCETHFSVHMFLTFPIYFIAPAISLFLIAVTSLMPMQQFPIRKVHKVKHNMLLLNTPPSKLNLTLSTQLPSPHLPSILSFNFFH